MKKKLREKSSPCRIATAGVAAGVRSIVLLSLSAAAIAATNTDSLPAISNIKDYTAVPRDFVYCTTCHGVELRGNAAVDAPRLNGMADWYVRNQMRAFANGWRGTHPQDLIGMEMQPQAAALSADQVEAAVAFVSSVPVRETRFSYGVTGDSSNGKNLYATCAACHGTGGEGNAALQAPRLSGQSDWYLARQLEKYRTGSRGYDAADSLGVQMRAAAAVLGSSIDVADVVAYINSFTPERLQPIEEIPMKKLVAASMLAGAAATAATAGAEVKRYPLPGSDFPIAQAVEVMPGTTIIYHSGMTPNPAKPDAERYSTEFWGDTEAQTLSVFQRLEESLTAKGLDFSNVVKMQIYLVGVPEQNGAMDFQGMMRAYRKYFGTEAQPNLPARSAFQVAGLAAPGMLVEIEVVLTRP